jgi:hypothetical protein
MDFADGKVTGYISALYYAKYYKSAHKSRDLESLVCYQLPIYFW